MINKLFRPFVRFYYWLTVDHSKQYAAIAMYPYGDDGESAKAEILDRAALVLGQGYVIELIHLPAEISIDDPLAHRGYWGWKYTPGIKQSANTVVT